MRELWWVLSLGPLQEQRDPSSKKPEMYIGFPRRLELPKVTITNRHAATRVKETARK